jgi:hypothetical protein
MSSNILHIDKNRYEVKRLESKYDEIAKVFSAKW